MRKPFFVLPAFLLLFSACSWTMNDQSTVDNTLPNTQAPAALIGGWANGFASFTQVIDAYNGRVLGNTWRSGTYFKITADGRNTQLYVIGETAFERFATQVSGTVRFAPEATSSCGSFTLLAIKGQYKGWGSTPVDREATSAELKNKLTRSYHYRMHGECLRIEADTEPNEHTSRFCKTEK